LRQKRYCFVVEHGGVADDSGQPFVAGHDADQRRVGEELLGVVPVLGVGSGVFEPRQFAVRLDSVHEPPVEGEKRGSPL